MGTVTPNQISIFIDGKETILTGDAIIEFEKSRADIKELFLTNQEKASQIAADKAALLAKLGITADEAKLLLS